MRRYLLVARTPRWCVVCHAGLISSVLQSLPVERDQSNAVSRYSLLRSLTPAKFHHLNFGLETELGGQVIIE